MKLWLDSADIEAARRWNCIARGITTNPVVLAKALLSGCVDVEERLSALCALYNPRPVSIQVWQLAACDILNNARQLHRVAHNAIVKVPVVDTEGQHLLWAIRKLSEEGIMVNATACMSAGQAIMAAEAGARYVSIFCGRIMDEGSNALEALTATGNAIDPLATEVVAGSIRTVGQVVEYSGVPDIIITAPPDVLHKMTRHARSAETVREFADEAERIGLT